MNLKTRIRSMAMRYLSSAGYLRRQRNKAQKQREKKGEPPVVHYFHCVDDPYSHLAVQKLGALKARYALKFQPHLVSKPDADFQGSSEYFDTWAVRDAMNIAAGYGVQFSPTPDNLTLPDNITRADQILTAHLTEDDFAEVAINIGTDLWAGKALTGKDANGAVERTLASGNTLRKRLGHYQGAMFYFDGEWFWGIDRIRLLEERLIDEGYDQQPGAICVPEPSLTEITSTLEGMNLDGVVLEYFPSLRSPYTAIGHQRVLDLISALAPSGITCKVRPVMPMMMRGIPAPQAKQRYIITDSAREGRAQGVPFGPMVDPFGEPVKRAFALYPAADALGKGMEFVTAYLNAAWFEGVDITRERGLMHVASNAGLNWQTLNQDARNSGWEAVLAHNLASLSEENLWGVPSFRVIGGNTIDGDELPSYACWGQDRIWRVADELLTRARKPGA